MIKTPQEMAKQYADTWNEDPEYRIAYDSFLAGYDAGYATGYNAGYTAGFDGCLKIQEATTEHLEKQMVEEMYVRMEPLLKEEK